MKEIRILLNEVTFTNICKAGFLSHRGESYGTIDIPITKNDIKQLATGKIITKDMGDDMIKIALQDIGFYLIKEIIRRSPMYSEMYYEI